ncbi:MAG: alpha/beta hydrolase, partial [Burkholderia sp.]|nr:alpha/beta hydrolase [Burkholderia sp.]
MKLRSLINLLIVAISWAMPFAFASDAAAVPVSYTVTS